MAQMLFTAKVLNDFRKRKLSRGRDPGSIIEKTLTKEINDFVRYLKTRYITPGSVTGSDFLAKRSGEMRGRTYGVTTRTSEYGSTGKIIIGEGLPYTALHVGNKSEKMTTLTTSKHFVIAQSSYRNQDGSWRAPFTSPLTSVPGLFKGSEKRNLSSHALYKVIGGKVTRIFTLSHFIRVPQRVDLNEIAERRKQGLLYTIRQAFGDLDVASLAKQVSGGVYEEGMFK